MLQLESWWQKALAGVAGGAANEILRLYLIATGHQSSPFFPVDAIPYLVVTAVYLGLAAVFTVLWDDSNPIKCFAIGVGLPRIIQSFAESGGQLPQAVTSWIG